MYTCTPRTTLREVFLARPHKPTTPFAHDAAVTCGSCRATSEHSNGTLLDLQLEGVGEQHLQTCSQRHRRRGRPATSSRETSCRRSSLRAAPLSCATSAAAAACSAAAAGPCVLRKHALAARIERVEAGGAPRAHAHRGRSPSCRSRSGQLRHARTRLPMIV